MNKAYLVGAEVLDDSTQLRLERSIESIRDILGSIAANESSWLSIVATAFGNNFDVSRLEALRLYDLSLLPEIEIRLAAELNGANGAFAGATNRIYLALEFLEQNDSEKISAVVLEEIGHWLDFQLNVKDSPGDEGEIFSALVRGQDLDASRLQVLKTEDDTSSISLDGQVIEVEQASARKPILIVPGIAGTFAKDFDSEWFLNRGWKPEQLQIDPLGGVYDDLIQTLKNVGYQEGVDLFVANYDWRLPAAPQDGVIDGTISGISTETIIDDTYEYGVDYLGYWLEQATESWQERFGETLESVDIIVHSTGGLVTRAYVQSDAYGLNLPEIDNFFMIGVPNRGASKAWNPLHDDWNVEKAYQFVLSKILNKAYQRVLDGEVITGSPAPISLETILNPSTNEPDPIKFINQYVPTIRDLLATYDFIDFGSGFTNINDNESERNSFLLDLNAGYDSDLLGDFVDEVGKLTVIYGTTEKTVTTVTQKVGGGSSGILDGELQPFTDFIANHPESDEIWYQDNELENNGDGTVPIESSEGLFKNDPRIEGNDPKIELEPFFTKKYNGKDPNTKDSVDHTGLVSNIDVQKSILETLSIQFQDSNISTDLQFGQFKSLVIALTELNILDVDITSFLLALDSFLNQLQDNIINPLANTSLPIIGDSLAKSGALQWISDTRNNIITLIEGGEFPTLEDFLDTLNTQILNPVGLSATQLGEKPVFAINLDRNGYTFSLPIDADLGFDWLGLDVNGNLNLTLDYDFIPKDSSQSGDIILHFDADGNPIAINNIKALQFGFNGDLSDFAAQGKLGFVDINLAQDPNLPSNFGAEVIVDLENLGNAPTFNFKPDNQLNFDLNTQFASDILPAISSDLKFDFGTSANLESVNFDNVKVDLGTFISPIAGKIQEVTSPIKPYVDFLDKDLKEVFDIGVVKDVLDVFDLNDDDKVNLVDFVYYYDPALGDSLKTFIDVFNSLASIGDGVPVGAIDLGSFSVDSSGNVASKTQAITAFAASGDGLHLPIIEDPFAAINLLLGKDVNLVTYELPKVNFDFTYEQSFPLIPPLEIVFGIGLGANIQFSGFGFDTYGLRRFADSDDLADILQGFYASDRSFVDGTGEDISEIGLNSRISLGGGVNLGIAKGGVNGYLSGELNFNLHDTNDDGKIRPYEFTLDPLELFDATAELNAGLNAYLKLDFGLFAKTLIDEDIADTSLIDPISFNEKPFSPSLGSKNSNNILLHVGTHTKDRNVEKGIVDEVFQVGQLETTIELFAFNDRQQIFFPDLSLVNAIVANGDVGNDSLGLLPGVIIAARFQGGDGNDVLIGAAAKDSLEGGTGEDLLVGGQGDDSLRGEAGIDTLYGEDGNDILEGNEDNDLLFGQVGNDNLAGGQGEDALYGYFGNDLLAGGSENDLLVGEQDNDTLFGNAGVDNLYGGEGDDEIHGGDDNDFLLGELGNDNLIGDAGVDTLYGGEGNDVLDGSAGDDSLYGEAGNNTVKGGLGNDLLDAAGYIDRNELYGQEGNDILKGSLANDLLDGGGDRDELVGSEGDDEIFGGDGNDQLLGEGGNDNLQGGLGEDLLLGGIGSDRGDGGEGKDTIYGGYDRDTLYGGSQTDSLYGETGDDELHGGDGDESVVLGAEGNDRIYGDAGADTLDGGDGNDQIYGNNDNDSLIGGAGDDLLVGDDFNDLAFPDSSGNDRLEGGVGNDELFGYLGDDTLVGGEGDDYLAGGLGDDTVEGGAGKDVFVLAPDSGVDTIKDFSLTSPDLDVIFLSDGLSFDFISVTDEAIETVDENGNPITISRAAIRDRDTGDLLAIVENVAAKDLGRAAFDEENVAPDRLEFESKKPIYGQDEVVTLIHTTVRDANGVNDLEIVDFWLQNPDGSWQNVRDVGWKGIDGSGIWGDYDKDDDLDLLIAGVNHNGLIYPIKIYRNNGDGSFSDLQLDLPQSFVNSLGIFWQDYDGDGDLDLLGYNYILNNRGDDTFTVSEILPNLAPTEDDSVLWGDFDGDGDSDVLLADTNSSKIYRNDGEDGFNLLQEDLAAVRNGIVAWGKDDRESYLLLTTEAIDSQGNPVTQTFLYSYNGTQFVLVSEDLFPNISPDSVDFADYNRDGSLDLILTGAEGFILDSTDLKGIARVYRGDGSGNFIADEDTPQLKPANPNDESIYDPGFLNGDAAWGDYDGDGDLDLLITGGSNQFGLNGETRTIARIPTTKLFSYQEEIGQFVEVETNLPELYHQAKGEHLSWEDYDKDGDRDLLVTGRDFFDNPLTKVYRNDGYGILGNGWKHSAPNLFFLSGLAEKTDVFVVDDRVGIETITNFEDGKDLLYLTPDLLFGSIRFEANGNDTEIIKSSTGNIIAKIIGVKPEQLSSEDFVIVLDNPDAATISIDNFEIGKDFIYLRGGLNLSAIELQSEIQEESENTKIVSKKTGKVLAQINNIAAETLSADLNKYFVVEKINFVDAVFTPILSNTSDTRLATFEYKLEGLDPGNYVLKGTAYDHQIASEERVLVPATGEPYFTNTTFVTLQGNLPNLLGLYTFENSVFPDSVEDLSGKGNYGVVSGATQIEAGFEGKAYQFDGVDDYIEIPFLNINPSLHPQVTIGAWVKADSLNINRNTIISHDNGGFDRTLTIDDRGGIPSFSAFSGTGAVLGSDSATLGDWVFLAAVYDQIAATVTLYVNEKVYTETGVLGEGLPYLNIGRNPSLPSELFTGAIDNVFVYDDALSPEQIAYIRENRSASFQWSKSIDNNILGFSSGANGVIVDNRGNIYSTGYTFDDLDGEDLGSSGDFRDAWIAKYDDIGNQIWIRQLGSSSDDYSFGITTDTQGHLYTTGYTEGDIDLEGDGSQIGGSDAWIAKYNNEGDRVWIRQFGSLGQESVYDLITDDRDLYLVGYTDGDLDGDGSGINAGVDDAWVAKYDASGDRVWIKQFGSANYDYANGIAIDNQGNLYLSGYTEGDIDGEGDNIQVGGQDPWVAKYDKEGNPIWMRQFGSIFHDYATDIATDSQGNLYLTGYTEGDMDGERSGSYAGNSDIWIAKYDAAGNPIWIKQFGTSGYDFANAISIDLQDNIYLTGHTQGDIDGNRGDVSAGAEDVWVAKYNVDGDRIWTKQLGSSSTDHAYDIAIDKQNNLYLARETFNLENFAYYAEVSKLSNVKENFILGDANHHFYGYIGEQPTVLVNNFLSDDTIQLHGTEAQYHLQEIYVSDEFIFYGEDLELPGISLLQLLPEELKTQIQTSYPGGVATTILYSPEGWVTENGITKPVGAPYVIGVVGGVGIATSNSPGLKKTTEAEAGNLIFVSPADDSTEKTNFTINTNGTQEGDTLAGTEGNDTLTGGDGNDTIIGYRGADYLDGGTGKDLLINSIVDFPTISGGAAVWGDYYRDSYFDIILPDDRVYINNGDGSFTFVGSIANIYPSEVSGDFQEADYDGDGDLDRLITSDEGKITVQRNDDGTFNNAIIPVLNASSTILNQELLKNGDVETGEPDEWNNGAFDDLEVVSTENINLTGLLSSENLGNFVFTSGTESAYIKTLSQSIDVIELAEKIDRGEISASLTALLYSGTYNTLGFEGVLTAIAKTIFLNGDGQVIPGEIDLEDTSSNSWDLLNGKQIIPSGTRTIIVELSAGFFDTFEITQGNPAFFDRVSLELSLAKFNESFGWEGDDRLWGDDNKDILDGGEGNDTLQGGSNADTLDGGVGNDVFDGGEDSDTVTYQKHPNGIVINSIGEGTPVTVIDGYGGQDSLIRIENAIGSEYSDRLQGNSLPNELSGLAGSDTLIGGDSNDTLNAGTGRDSLEGEFGDDTLENSGGADILKGGQDNDLYTFTSLWLTPEEAFTSLGGGHQQQGKIIRPSNGNEINWHTFQNWSYDADVENKYQEFGLEVNPGLKGQGLPWLRPTIIDWMDLDEAFTALGGGENQQYEILNPATGEYVSWTDFQNLPNYQDFGLFTDLTRQSQGLPRIGQPIGQAFAGSIIEDEAGDRDAIDLPEEITLSLQSLTVGITGLAQVGKDLAIDLDRDGVAIQSNDLFIRNFFGENGYEAGTGFIEQVGNLSGSDILTLSQSFTPVEIPLPEIGEVEGWSGTTEWGDYDNDGDLDVLVTGQDSQGQGIALIYRNDGGSFTSSITLAGLERVESTVWGDYDGDSYLDILLVGSDTVLNAESTQIDREYFVKVYRNQTNDRFNVTQAISLGKENNIADADAGDYDNDGDLDLVVLQNNGTEDSIAKLYRFDTDNFTTLKETVISGLSDGSVDWQDYDVDGNLDLIVSGWENSNNQFTTLSLPEVSKVYQTDSEGNFVVIPNETIVNGFSNESFVSEELNTLVSNDIAWGDYNNDGNIDALITRTSNDLPTTDIYTGNGQGDFTLQDNQSLITSIQRGEAAWGDYDSDGDLDILIAGAAGSNGIPFIQVYRNNAVELGQTPNQAPSIPEKVKPEFTDYNPTDKSITLRWSPPEGDETPTSSLTYNLRIGTIPGGSDLLAPTNAAENGNLGYAVSAITSQADETGSQKQWTIGNLQPGTTYYWSIQAIDRGGQASDWTSDILNSFTINSIDWDNPKPLINTVDSSILLTDGAIAWGDYDSDGDFDLLKNLKIYQQAYDSATGQLNYREITSLPGLEELNNPTQTNAVWGDYDNDSDLDLLVALTADGQHFTRLYTNTEGIFNQTGSDFFSDFTPTNFDRGDFNNDGKLDLLVIGSQDNQSIARIYRGDGQGNFSQKFGEVNLAGGKFTDTAWGDSNRDGYLDILLVGTDADGQNYAGIIYNREGIFDLTQNFHKFAPNNLNTYNSGSFGDYDNDGDLDVLLAGKTETLVVGIEEEEFTYNSNSLNLHNQGNISYADWVDYDSDGDLDVVLSIDYQDFTGTELYSNNSVSKVFDRVLTPEREGKVVFWDDYNSDGKLEVFLDNGNAYNNLIETTNTTPTAPTELNTAIYGTNVTFTWNPGSDGETNPEGLTYNLRVGTTPGGSEILSIATDANVGHNRQVTLNTLPDGVYYWSVQTVDSVKSTSNFADERSFVIGFVDDAIADADLPPAVAIDNLILAEGNESTTTETFTVKLTKPSSDTVTVNYTTVDRTAKENEDYTPTNGTITFNPGEESKTISVEIKGDKEEESDETFSIDLSDPTGAKIKDFQGVITIQNDDSIISLPDLILTDFAAPATAIRGQNITISGKIKNQGDKDTSIAPYYALYLSSDTVFDPQQDTIIPLVVEEREFFAKQLDKQLTINEEIQFEEQVKILLLVEDANYNVLLVTDPGNYELEKGETTTSGILLNNIRTLPITVLQPQDENGNDLSDEQVLAQLNLPDLAITTPPDRPIIAKPGDEIAVSWSVTNQGKISVLAGEWSSFFFLSPDNLADVSDTLVLEIPATEELAVGQTLNLSGHITIPANASDNSYLLFAAFPTQQIDSDTNNNFRAIPLESNNNNPPLQVINVQTNLSGFVLQFNQAIDLTVLNLYRGQNGSQGQADLTLVDAEDNPVSGSVVWDETSNSLTFIKTGGLLEAGTYDLTLFSRDSGFISANGQLLDGNKDGTVGENDNYTQEITVESAITPILSLADFSRAPTQTVDGLPISIENGETVRSVEFELSYNPDLLEVIDVSTDAAGWQIVNSEIDAENGRLSVTVQGNQALSGDNLILLDAKIPDDATYGASDILQFDSIVFKDAESAILPGRGDTAIQQIAYFGDASGNEEYSSFDASLIDRVAEGLDTGFDSFPNTDPIVLGDISGDGIISNDDALDVARFVVGLPQPEIPNI